MRVAGAEDVVLLRDISWDTYRRINDDNFSPGVRMAFFEGALEIMSVSAGHENRRCKLEALLQTLAGEMLLDVTNLGSVTMLRDDLRAGLEADACFYFGPMAALMRTQEELNLHTDPAPDLAIEVDISKRSFSKLPLCAALGIRELWEYHENRVELYELTDGEYRTIPESIFLPHMAATRLTQLLADSRILPFPEWMKRVRAAAAGRRD